MPMSEIDAPSRDGGLPGRYLFPAFVFTIGITRWASVRLGGMIVQISDLMFAATAIAWAIQVALGRRSIRLPRLTLWVAPWAVALVIAAAASEVPRTSAMKLVGSGYLIAILLLTAEILDSTAALRRAVVAWIAGASLNAFAGVLGVLEFYAGIRGRPLNPFTGGFGSLPAGNYPRLVALTLNYNMLALFMSTSFSITIIAMLAGWISKRNAAICGGAMAFTCFFALSPQFGGWMLAAGLWVWVFARRAGMRWTARGAIAAGLLGAIAFVIVSTVTIWGGTIESAPRLEIWKRDLGTIAADPITGRGPGLGVIRYSYTTPSGNTQHLTDAHEMWLSILGQNGVVGLAGFAVLLVGLLRMLRRIRAETPLGDAFRVGLTIAFVEAVFYQGLTGSFEDTRHIWLLFGLIAAAAQIFSSPPATASQEPAGVR